MRSSILAFLGVTFFAMTGVIGTKSTVNIALYGPDPAEISTVVHSLKAGKYAQSQATIHPFLVEIIIGEVTVNAVIPSANEGARLGWRSELSDYDGIVYLVDPERHATSKTELDDILNDGKITKPVLVLTPKPNEGREQLPKLELPQMTKGGQPVTLHTYSLSPKPEGIEEGFEWLLKQIPSCGTVCKLQRVALIGFQWLLGET